MIRNFHDSFPSPTTIMSQSTSQPVNNTQSIGTFYINAAGSYQLLKAYAHCIVRLFYSPPAIVIMDTLINIRRALSAKEVSLITGMHNLRYVELILRGLAMDQMIRSINKKQKLNPGVYDGPLSAEELAIQKKNQLDGTTHKDIFLYYIDYVQFQEFHMTFLLDMLT